jgi:hypothetical protein
MYLASEKLDLNTLRNISYILNVAKTKYPILTERRSPIPLEGKDFPNVGVKPFPFEGNGRLTHGWDRGIFDLRH